MRSLDAYEKPQLIEAIGRIIALFPPALGAFDVPGFAAQDADVDE
jgi:hypothetical protein